MRQRNPSPNKSKAIPNTTVSLTLIPHHIMLMTIVGTGAQSSLSLGSGEEVDDYTTKMAALENVNPKVFKQRREREILPEEEDENVADEIDQREVFDILCVLLPIIRQNARLALRYLPYALLF